MKGDFSKMTFAPDKNFLRVLMQQGRVQLDADWNEQAAILLHYIQTLATDLIGPYAGPVDNLGFSIGNNKGDFGIGKGRYYVDGILCENHEDVTYLTQLDYKANTLKSGVYIVYLDVWERHISYLEDDDIREKALNGVDTATRSKVIWQVKAKEWQVAKGTDINAKWLDAIATLKDELLLSEACLRARVKPVETETNACSQSPDAKYRGAENQLYRIEIHNAGNNASFKWSRENGAVAFPIIGITLSTADNKITVELENLGRDDKLGLKVNDWVELVDDEMVLKNSANPLCQVFAIDTMSRTVVLTGTSQVNNASKHPLLRRWDQDGDANGLAIKTSEWLPIEAGIEVQFQLNGKLRTGDYWLIPARTNTGEIECPVETAADGSVRKDANGNVIAAAMSPHGEAHHFAPLAIINVDTNSNITLFKDFRCRFKPLSYDCQYSYYGRLGHGIGTDLLCIDKTTTT